MSRAWSPELADWESVSDHPSLQPQPGDCPHCGGTLTTAVANVFPERGAPAPGERCVFRCDEGEDCPTFIDVMPEPVSPVWEP